MSVVAADGGYLGQQRVRIDAAAGAQEGLPGDETAVVRSLGGLPGDETAAERSLGRSGRGETAAVLSLGRSGRGETAAVQGLGNSLETKRRPFRVWAIAWRRNGGRSESGRLARTPNGVRTSAWRRNGGRTESGQVPGLETAAVEGRGRSTSACRPGRPRSRGQR